jgi:hypothetical protein
MGRNGKNTIELNDYMTAAELEKLTREIYSFYVNLGAAGEPVGKMLLDLEDKIAFLAAGNEARL